MADAEPIRRLIVACGNTLRSDDGVGPWLAAWAEEQFRNRAEIGVISRQQWTPELAEEIARAESVIFVDSSTASAAGAIALERVWPAEDAAGAGAHHLSAAQLLALASELYGSMPRTSLLLTIGAGSTELGESFSPAVEAALKQACALLAELAADPSEAIIHSIRTRL